MRLKRPKLNRRLAVACALGVAGTAALVGGILALQKGAMNGGTELKGAQHARQLVVVANDNLDSLLAEEPKPWLLAQSLPLNGPSGHIGERFSVGIDTALRDVNARGGIAGRPIKIWRIDDGYEPDEARRNTRWFAAEPDVLALFGYFGTPTSHAALPVAQAAGLTLVAPLTGASSLRNPGQSNPLHFRASYAEEAQRIVDHLVNDGFVRIAVAYQNDAYGKDVLSSTVKALQQHGMKPITTAALPRNSVDTSEAANTIAEANPDALVVISLSKTMASLVQDLSARRSSPQLMTISPTATMALFTDLPQSLSYGIGVTQVVPFPWDGRHPDVALYQRLMREQQDNASFDFISLEGFLAARWLVQALEAIAPDISRERLVEELSRTSPDLKRNVNLVFLGSGPWQP